MDKDKGKHFIYLTKHGKKENLAIILGKIAITLWKIESKEKRRQKRRMMIINELADHLITMALIMQLNANCPRWEWPMAWLPPSSPLAKVTIKGQQQQQQSIGENRQKCNWRTAKEREREKEEASGAAILAVKWCTKRFHSNFTCDFSSVITKR